MMSKIFFFLWSFHHSFRLLLSTFAAAAAAFSKYVKSSVAFYLSLLRIVERDLIYIIAHCYKRFIILLRIVARDLIHLAYIKRVGDIW
jgi:hypothetical protein